MKVSLVYKTQTSDIRRGYLLHLDKKLSPEKSTPRTSDTTDAGEIDR
jgi:hypothetical protein